MHAQVWAKVSFEGHYHDFDKVKDFSSCEIVDFESSKCHFVFYPKTETIKHYIAMETDKRIIIVVAHPTEVIRT